MRAVLVLASVLALAAPARAQPPAAMPAQPAASCAAMDAKLPADLADWNGKAAVLSAPAAEQLEHMGALDLGKGYEASLLKTSQITFPVQPEKPGGSVSSAGLFQFTVPSAGNYTVALGTAAWIDVLENGKVVTPTSFGHGPECTSIPKIVVFPLQPGKHVLQVSANADPKLKLMVAKKP